MKNSIVMKIAQIGRKLSYSGFNPSPSNRIAHIEADAL